MSRDMTALAVLAAAMFLSTAPAIAADGPLMAGVATVDITPEPGLMLWGYSNRTHGATGTLDPLMAKAVVLRGRSVGGDRHARSGAHARGVRAGQNTRRNEVALRRVESC